MSRVTQQRVQVAGRQHPGARPGGGGDDMIFLIRKLIRYLRRRRYRA
jgi:hypothetical protein